MTNNRNLSPKQLKQIRKDLNLSQSALADLLDLGHDGGRAIRRYESGERAISGPIRFSIKAIADGYLPPGWADHDEK